MGILVTGASGTVGREVVRQLLEAGHEVHAGTRAGTDPIAAGAVPVRIDFETGIVPAQRFDALFLMRPPQMTDPDIFAAFLTKIAPETVIVFLSVQGAETKTYLPHAKIEKRIESAGFAHVFVRPSYFMDNLLSTLWQELEASNRIYLPAGRLALDWVAARDVAGVCAAALTGQVSASAVTVCSGLRIGFADVCATINDVVGTHITYVPASLLGFIGHMRRRNAPWSFIAVMLLLHTLPRFGRQPQRQCGQAAKILGRDLECLEDFIVRNKDHFEILKVA